MIKVIIDNATSEPLSDTPHWNTKESTMTPFGFGGYNDNRCGNGWSTGISYVNERIAFHGLSMFNAIENTNHPYAYVPHFEYYCVKIRIRLYVNDGINKHIYEELTITNIDWINLTCTFTTTNGDFNDQYLGTPAEKIYKRGFFKSSKYSNCGCIVNDPSGASDMFNSYFFDWWIRTRDENVLIPYQESIISGTQMPSIQKQQWGDKTFGIDYTYYFDWDGDDTIDETVTNSYEDIVTVKQYDNTTSTPQEVTIETIEYDNNGTLLPLEGLILTYTDNFLEVDGNNLWLSITGTLGPDDPQYHQGDSYFSVMLAPKSNHTYINIQEYNKESIVDVLNDVYNPLDIIPQITDNNLYKDLTGWSSSTYQASCKLNIKLLTPNIDYLLMLINVSTFESTGPIGKYKNIRYVTIRVNNDSPEYPTIPPIIPPVSTSNTYTPFVSYEEPPCPTGCVEDTVFTKLSNNGDVLDESNCLYFYNTNQGIVYTWDVKNGVTTPYILPYAMVNSEDIAIAQSHIWMYDYANNVIREWSYVSTNDIYTFSYSCVYFNIILQKGFCALNDTTLFGVNYITNQFVEVDLTQSPVVYTTKFPIIVGRTITDVIVIGNKIYCTSYIGAVYYFTKLDYITGTIERDFVVHVTALGIMVYNGSFYILDDLTNYYKLNLNSLSIEYIGKIDDNTILLGGTHASSCISTTKIDLTDTPCCIEILDSSCVLYTGEDFNCGDKMNISKYDNITIVVNKIYDMLCLYPNIPGPKGLTGPIGYNGQDGTNCERIQFFARIIPDPNDTTGFGYTVVVEHIEDPTMTFTYQWEITGMFDLPIDSTTVTVLLTPVLTYGLISIQPEPDIQYIFGQLLITVTDTYGNKTYDSRLIDYIGYNPET